MLTVQLGSQKTTYSQMIDSGSSLLSLPCNTAASHARKCNHTPSLYTLGAQNLLTEGQCMADTTGCFATTSESSGNGSNTTGNCAWSSALTGGQGYNGYLGSFGADTITLPGALNMGGLAWEGIFACYDDNFFCPEVNGSECLSSYVGCPAPSVSEDGDNCPKPGGLEAGVGREP